jgi:uncharacterized C2H2 Zn-finger protein
MAPEFVGTYICPACKMFFKTKEELDAHVKLEHPTGSKPE